MRAGLLTVAVAIWALVAGFPLRPLARAETGSADVDALITDCASALAEPFHGVIDTQVQQIAAGFQSAKVQAIAKKIADALEIEPITDSDIADPHLEGLSMKFKTALSAQVPSGLLPDEDVARNWIDFMTPRRAFSCFPDLVAVARTYVSRVEAARQAVKKQQQEQAQRQQEEAQQQVELAKDPVNVLGTAYHAYLDVKRCYEAREGYAMGYITDQEIGLAKNAVKQIEDAMKPKLDPDTTTEDLWSRVEKKEGHHFYPRRDYAESDRRLCREGFNWLLEILRKQVPESGRIEKDF